MMRECVSIYRTRDQAGQGHPVYEVRDCLGFVPASRGQKKLLSPSRFVLADGTEVSRTAVAGVFVTAAGAALSTIEIVSGAFL